MSTPDTRLVISLETLLKGLGPTLKGLGQIEKRLRDLTKIKPPQGKSLQQPAATFDRASLAAQRYAQAQKRADQASQRLAVAQKNISAANIRAANSYERARRAAERLNDQQQRAASFTRKGGSSFLAGAAGGLTALVGVSVISAIKSGGEAWFEYASKLEATKIAFTTMLGSAEAATIHLKELQQFALTTPFEFSDLIEASQRMQALGFEANQVVPILTDVGNAVAAAGGGSERLDRIIVALSQMQSKGKVATQEMNQLAEAGIPAWKILEKQFGKSRAELIKMVEQGKISSKVFLDAFQKFSQQNFGGLMEKQSKTAIGAISNLKDAVLQLSSTAFQPLFNLITNGLNEVAGELQKNQASWETWGRKISTSIANNVAGITALIKELRNLDRQIGESLNLAAIGDELEKSADRLETSQTQALATAVALINSLRGAPTKGQRFDDEGEFAIAGNIPAALKTKDETVTTDSKSGKSALNRLRQLNKQLIDAVNQFANIKAENQLATLRTSIEQQFDLTKDGLDRELQLLEGSFEDRLVSVKKFYEDRQKLQEAQVDVELTREKALSDALAVEFKNRREEIEGDFQSAKLDIESDPDLKGRARTIALQTAEQTKQNALAKAFNEFQIQSATVSTKILQLQEKRAGIGATIAREAKSLTDELKRQEEQLSFDLSEEQGATFQSAGGRLKAQFKETIKDLRIDITSLSPELQTALNKVDLTVLKANLAQLPEPVRILIDLLEIGISKARIAEQVADVDRTLAELRLQEIALQNKVLDGVLTEKEAREQILGIQQITRDRMLDILAAQLAIAKATEGQGDEVLRIQSQIQEIQRLGKAVDEVGRQINEDLLGDIQSGFEGFFQGARRGFEGLKDAAINFGESLLNTLNRIAAASITQKLEGLFKPGSENTEGTPGGRLSRIFGLAPKAAEGSALTGAATAAGTALTTGATAAATALTTGGATAGATIAGSMAASAASFAAAVIAAGAAFAATVAASAAAQAIGGAGGGIAGALGGAATGMFPAVPGGMVRIVEGNYPEAILTTDPRHAVRQVQILRAYLAKTKGLFGRIRMPEFATGGFVSARDVEMNLLSSIQRAPSFISSVPETALATRSEGWGDLRIINQVASRDLVRPYMSSEDGVRDILNIVSRNANEIRRRIKA